MACGLTWKQVAAMLFGCDCVYCGSLFRRRYWAEAARATGGAWLPTFALISPDLYGSVLLFPSLCALSGDEMAGQEYPGFCGGPLELNGYCSRRANPCPQNRPCQPCVRAVRVDPLFKTMSRSTAAMMAWRRRGPRSGNPLLAAITSGDCLHPALRFCCALNHRTGKPCTACFDYCGGRTCT